MATTDSPELAPSPAREALRLRIAAGETVMIDGATGTELEHRGADMDGHAWCATASMTHPALLREVHEDYIRAGAKVITANTFATHRTRLAASGLDGKFESINRDAIRLAFEARENTGTADSVVVAASLSHSALAETSPEGELLRLKWPLDAAARDISELANLCADAGAELLMMEMISDPELAAIALDAARATGLPSWLGMTLRLSEDGELVSEYRRSVSAKELFESLDLSGIEAVGIMHSGVEATTRGLELLGHYWQGPTMAYPDSGYFELPHWRFVDVMPPDVFVEHQRQWIASGVQIVGGCCGLGLDHMQALGEALKSTA